MWSFSEIMPDPEMLLTLAPEELAGVLLIYLKKMEQTSQMNRHNFNGLHTVEGYPQQYRLKALGALLEAWGWLEKEGLIASKPNERHEWIAVTRKGMALRTEEDFEAYKKSTILSKESLHNRIATKIYSAFMRGEYDVAVFQAFREVEVAVREAGKYSPNDYGVSLMRKAFDVEKGPLSDASAPSAERQATSDLFSGAIGLYKNPHSHRNILIEDPNSAVEMILFASHLLRIIDGRITN